jgi:hypothetical protein
VTTRVLATIILVACIVLAGCASSDKDSDNNGSRFGGFYGGVNSGGGGMP